MIYYTQKRKPLTIHIPKKKQYRIAQKKAVIHFSGSQLSKELTDGLKLSQRIDQTILAFREKYYPNFKKIN